MATSNREAAFAGVRTRLAALLASASVVRRTAAPVAGRNVPRGLFPRGVNRLVWVVQRDTDLRIGEKPGKVRLQAYQREHRGEAHLMVRAADEDAVPTVLNALTDEVEVALTTIEQEQRQDPQWHLSLESFEAGEELLNQGVYGAGLVRFRIREYA